MDRAGADLWCRIGPKIVTVQVKSSRQAKPPRKSSSVPYYSFLTLNNDSDWHCFAAMDRELILMRATPRVTGRTLRISPSEFNEANQRRTIEEIIKSC